MIYSDFYIPSKNMNISQKEMISMVREQEEELARLEQDKAIKEQSEDARARAEQANFLNNYIAEQENAVKNRATFLENTKDGFLTAAIFNLYKECTDLDRRGQIIGKNLVSKFVKEQGAGTLLSRFKYQNILLGEMSRIVEKAYGAVVEAINRADDDENNRIGAYKDYKLDKTIVDDFYKDLASLDTVEASKLIKDRVSDAVAEFIDTNMNNKLDYEEVIKAAQERIDVAQDESAVEFLTNNAKRKINEMKQSRYKNVFNYLVEALTKETFKDEALKTRYVHESSVDMDSIVDSAKLIYTMLEMQHTTGMVSDEYIQEYIVSLAE